LNDSVSGLTMSKSEGWLPAVEIAHRDFDVAIFELDGVLTDPQAFTLLREKRYSICCSENGQNAVADRLRIDGFLGIRADRPRCNVRGTMDAIGSISFWTALRHWPLPQTRAGGQYARERYQDIGSFFCYRMCASVCGGRSARARPIAVRPYGTVEVFIAADDVRGGTGANFLVGWAAPRPIAEPVIEAVMIGSVGTSGFSFATQGRGVRIIPH
jgi:hypothetical protein